MLDAPAVRKPIIITNNISLANPGRAGTVNRIRNLTSAVRSSAPALQLANQFHSHLHLLFPPLSETRGLTFGLPHSGDQSIIAGGSDYDDDDDGSEDDD